MMGQDNSQAGKLEGPLHNSLRSYFMRYYTVQEKSEERQQAERRGDILARITDRQEES